MSTGHEILTVGTAGVDKVFEWQDNRAEQTGSKIFLWTTRHRRRRDAENGVTEEIGCDYDPDWVDYLMQVMRVACDSSGDRQPRRTEGGGHDHTFLDCIRFPSKVGPPCA